MLWDLREFKQTIMQLVVYVCCLTLAATIAEGKT